MSWRFVLRRVLQVPFVLAAIVVVTFSVVQFVPGDPVYLLAGENPNPEQLEQVRQDYGFDRSIPAQFLTYAGRVLRGDLGESYSQGLPVRKIITDRAGPTLLLTGTALVVSTFGGLLLAVLAVRKPLGWLDKAINAGTLIVYAIPGFWLAQLAILYVVLRWHLLPIGGYSEFGADAPTGLGHLGDVARHLALPAMVLAVTEVAAVTRVLRSGLLRELGQEYVRTAEAKGLPRDVVISRHALRNAMLPMVTVIGARVGFLLSGAAVVETIFVWPGLGSTLLSAVGSSDRPLMLGMVLVASFAVVTANLLTDIVYRWVDPRIRYD